MFQKKRHRVKLNGQVQGRFDTEELEKEVRQIIEQNDPAGEDALLKGPKDQQCKMLVPLPTTTTRICKEKLTIHSFVCAMSKEVADPVLFTSYPSSR